MKQSLFLLLLVSFGASAQELKPDTSGAWKQRLKTYREALERYNSQLRTPKPQTIIARPRQKGDMALLETPIDLRPDGYARPGLELYRATPDNMPVIMPDSATRASLRMPGSDNPGGIQVMPARPRK